MDAKGRVSVPVQFRRALALMLMTLVLPGSAQLAAGNRRVGRIALRVVFALVCTVVLIGLMGWKWHGLVFFLASNTFVLGLIRVALCVLAVGWALLFLDAWRLGRPLELRQKQRMAMVGLNGYRIPTLEQTIDENLRCGRLVNPSIAVAGLCINTSALAAGAADAYLREVSGRLALPACDPVRTGVAAIVDRLGL